MSKHTPGPWKFFKDTRYGPWDTVLNKCGNPHYYQWCIESDTRKLMAILEVPYLSKCGSHSPATKKEHAKTIKEVHANACLIAAAPDMLSTLDEIRCWLISPDLDPSVIEAYRRDCEIAIAKAKGQQ